MGDWLGPLILLTGWWLSSERTDDNHPLRPWHNIGSSAWVVVENRERDSLEVSALAPEVDDAVRPLGWVAGSRSTVLRLPYADTDVYIVVGSHDYKLKVSRPGYYTVVVDTAGVAQR